MEEIREQLLKIISTHSKYDADTLRSVYDILGSWDDIFIAIYFSDITHLNILNVANRIVMSRANPNVVFKKEE
jgi:hypothetical protein